MSVADELGGTARVQEIMKGQGVSFILKSISVQYKRPVTFPDTVRFTFHMYTHLLTSIHIQLLVAHKVHLPEASLDRNEWPKSHFHLAGTIWSCAQRAIVTDSDSVIVWYDYDKLRKCDPGAESREAVWRRIKPT
jgi:acyl-CoA thioesterase FadM